MKKIIFLVLCSIALFSNTSFSQNIATENIFIIKSGATTTHSITVSYPISNQAKLRDLRLEIVSPKSGNPKLKISGKIQNMLKRDLLNGEVLIEISGLEEGINNAINTKVVPRSIDRDRRFGNFSAEIDYTKNITTCIITITWQGQK